MTIVVGYADRPEGRAALEAAAREAELRDATLHVVEVFSEAPGARPAQVAEWRQRLDIAREHGEQQEQALRERGLRCNYTLLAGGASAADEILATARTVAAVLIVIGIRRRSAVGKVVLGSVAQDVLLGADCQVLAVKAPE